MNDLEVVEIVHRWYITVCTSFLYHVMTTCWNKALHDIKGETRMNNYKKTLLYIVTQLKIYQELLCQNIHLCIITIPVAPYSQWITVLSCHRYIEIKTVPKHHHLLTCTLRDIGINNNNIYKLIIVSQIRSEPE